MNVDKQQILIIDDAPEDVQFLIENLKPDYSIIVATDGKKGFDLARNSQPEAILLDVVMPGTDGYKTCQLLKQDETTKGIDIIFVSANNTLEEKMAGYDAGGSDYLIKPVQPDEVKRKVKLAVENKAKREKAVSEKVMAMQTAQVAMTNAGEQGIVLSFLRNSINCSEYEELAQLILDSVSGYGLESCVQIRINGMALNMSSTPSSPLEIDIIDRLKDQDKIMELGKRTVFNFANISLFIRNMPDDEEKRGRLRDHIAIILEGAENKMQSIDMSKKLLKTEVDKTLKSFILESNRIMKKIQNEQKTHKQHGQKIMDNMLQELEASFLEWGLTEDQEYRLLNVVQTGLDKSMRHMEIGSQIDMQMKQVIEGLEQKLGGSL